MGAEDAADCFDVIIRCISEIIKSKNDGSFAKYCIQCNNLLKMLSKINRQNNTNYDTEFIFMQLIYKQILLNCSKIGQENKAHLSDPDLPQYSAA